jgi:hypothetical protein
MSTFSSGTKEHRQSMPVKYGLPEMLADLKMAPFSNVTNVRRIIRWRPMFY